MGKVGYFGILYLGSAFIAMATPLAIAQVPNAQGVVETETVTARQPGGLLGERLGTYLTIGGVRSEGVKLESGTFLVDTINGKKLDKPVSVLIRGASIVNHNLQPARLDLPAQQRCIFKGFETGEMIGVPPAVAVAAKEQGWRKVPMSPTAWRWRPSFVVLVVVEPQDLNR